jgi:hypothetical protein
MEGNISSLFVKYGVIERRSMAKKSKQNFYGRLPTLLPTWVYIKKGVA